MGAAHVWMLTAQFLSKSTSETTVKRVSLLSDMHLRNIRTKLLLMSRNHEATKHLEVGGDRLEALPHRTL